MRAWRPLLAVVVFGTMRPALALADPSSPADVASARAHYKKGVELYEAGRYEQALGELQTANGLAPTSRLLYDIALVQRQLGDAAGALRSFSAYLDAGAEVPAARRAEVQQAIVALGAKVATVTVSTSVVGAEVTADDRVVGTTPLASPLQLNAGPHRLQATRAGYATGTRALDVRGGDRLDVVLELPPATLPSSSEPAPPPPAAPPPSPPPPTTDRAAPPPPIDSSPPLAPPPPAAPIRRPLWIGWTAAGVLAGGAAATGIAALVESHHLKQDIEDHASSAATIHSAHTATTTLALVSDVLTGSAVAAAGITLYVQLVTDRGGAAPTARAEVRAGPGSLWFSATF